MVLKGFCVAILSMVLFCSCGANPDIVPNQREAIVKFLGTKDFTIQDGVYKYIANRDRADYDDAPMAVSGDSIVYNFEAYSFATTKGNLYYTNKPRLIDAMAGLNSQYWIREPIRVKVGATPMIKGLAKGLPYCKQGDSVVLFITSDMAYGDKMVGLVPKSTALMYILNIENVKK